MIMVCLLLRFVRGKTAIDIKAEIRTVVLIAIFFYQTWSYNCLFGSKEVITLFEM